MATYSGEIRQGLPRVPGGEPWPAGGTVAGVVTTQAAPLDSGVDVDQVRAEAPVSVESVAPAEVAPVESAAPVETAAPIESVAPSVSAEQAAASVPGVPLRRGLPRVAGGDAWPAAGMAAVPAAAGAASVTQTSVTQASEPAVEAAVAARHAAAEAPVPEAAAAPAAPVPGAGEFVASETPLRRGLPRTPDGEAWPAEGFAPVATRAPAAASPVSAPAAPAAVTPVAEVTQAAATPAEAPAGTPETSAPVFVQQVEQTETKPAAQAAPAAVQQPEKPVKPKRDPVMIRGKALSQWVKLAVLGVVGAIVAAGVIVLAARGVTTLPGVPEWLERYPGEYDLPESAEPGFPWWARWSHALNIFLIVLIIRSGLLVRQQEKPPAFWTSKRGGKKISINLWLHTSLDVVWLANGVIFVVLLFVSGHWMRIVPTSFEVFPNAMSAMLQYLTLDWPTEHGWVNYNSLQQIMYFLIIFIAAPLAAITGVRMSEWWPKDAEKLNKFYPAPVARALHFPTMLFFVLFILVHVFLVFTTGALRNLNHMFAGTDVVNWTGFWFFALTIFLTAAGWVAARPLVLAPIANLTGKVSNR